MPTTLPFKPFPLLSNRHLQTIVAAKLTWPVEPPSLRRLVSLPDGDQIALEVSTPPGWCPGEPTVLILHGLCGCHQSTYVQRMAYNVWRRGWRAIRMNMRGCGSGQGLARQCYHSGRSADLQAVLEALQQETPCSPVTLLGFSLGGNIMLKWAGDLRERAAGYSVHVIAVCPPADLAACVRLMARPLNRVYERHFIARLRAAVAFRHAYFAELPPITLPERLSLYDFDQLYTAPQNGFRDADDYYARCSAAPWVPRITLPCRILFAADDPFIDGTIFDHVALPSNVHVYRTPRGGHLGFLGAPWRPGGYRWMDTLLLEWIDTMSPSRSPAVAHGSASVDRRAGEFL